MSNSKATLLFIACLVVLAIIRCAVAHCARGPNDEFAPPYDSNGEYVPPVRGFQ